MTAIGSRTVRRVNESRKRSLDIKRHDRVQGSRDHNDHKKQSLGVWNLEKKWKEMSYGQKKRNVCKWRPWRRAMSRANGERDLAT